MSHMTDAEFQAVFDEHKDAVYRFVWRHHRGIRGLTLATGRWAGRRPAGRRVLPTASTWTRAATATVVEQRLYQLIRQPKPIVDRQVEIEFLDAGVETYAFTFG
jgi:hypothetical protein